MKSIISKLMYFGGHGMRKESLEHLTTTREFEGKRAGRFDEGPWPRISGMERQRMLERAAELVEQQAHELALCETLDIGKALYFAEHIDARIMSDLLRYYAGMASEIQGATRIVAPPPDRQPMQTMIVP